MVDKEKLLLLIDFENQSLMALLYHLAKWFNTTINITLNPKMVNPNGIQIVLHIKRFGRKKIINGHSIKTIRDKLLQWIKEQKLKEDILNEIKEIERKERALRN